MSEVLSNIPWFAWIAIVGIIAWLVVTTVSYLTGQAESDSDQVEERLAQTDAALKDVVERLDSIDKRLERIEKTLTDIP